MALELPRIIGERLSQVLPTVKCSTCSKPVALSELSDHVCTSLPPPSPSTPRPAAILAKIRQAPLFISTSNLPDLASIPHVFQRAGSPAPRSQTPVGNRAKQPRSGLSPSTSPPPAPGATPEPISRQRNLSIVRAQTSLQSGSLLPPQQIPLPASPIPPTPLNTRFDTFPRSSTPQAPSPVAFPTRSGTPVTHRPRLASLTRLSKLVSRSSSSSSGGAASARERVPSTPDFPPARATSSQDSVNVKPNFNTLPILRSTTTPSVQQPTIDNSDCVDPILHSDRETRTPAAPLLTAGPERPVATIHPPTCHPVSPVGQVGGANAGEVNMAGVGRRGFQAAVQAAMAAQFLGKVIQAPDRMRTPTAGMDGRRNNTPTQLNISAEVAFRQTASSSSLSPDASVSPHSPRTPSPRSPHTPETISSPTIARTPSTASTARIPSPFSQRFNKNELEINTKALPVNTALPLSPDSEYSGLAYDHGIESSPSHASPIYSEAISSIIPEIIEKVPFPASSTSPSQFAVDVPTRSASCASSYSYASRNTSKSTSALDRAFDQLLEETLSPPLSAAPLSPRSPKLPTRSRTAPIIPASKIESCSARSRPRQCTRCSKVIEDGRWIRAENSGVLCAMCWKMMYLPKCRQCNRPIERHAISSADGQLKGKYHRECFNCFKCQQPFPDKEFYVFDGKPYCRYHYHEANDSLCSDPGCGQPIEGACAVTHSGERYHPEHLLCDFRVPGSDERCHERLEEYWEVDGRMLCELHMEIVCSTLPKPSDLSMPNPFGEDLFEGQDTDGTSLVNSETEFDIRATIAGYADPRDSLRNSMDVRAMRRRTQFIDLR